MSPLYLEGQEDTPEIYFDKEKSIFKISGRSLPEDVMDFYTPLYDWLKEYIKNPNNDTKVDLKIDYFNSASYKAINELFDILSEVIKMGKFITINWHYMEEDEEMHESGVDFAELTGLNFVYKTYTV
jgi:hypothetical protein